MNPAPLVSFYCQCGTPLSAPVGTPTVVCHKCGITMGVPVQASAAPVGPPAAARSPAPPILAALGIVALLAGVLPTWWFHGREDPDDHGGVSIGLVEAKVCDGGRCTTIDYGGLTYGSVPSSFHDFIQYGKWSYWTAIISSIALAGACVVWLARLRLPVSAGAIAGGLAIGAALLAILAFVTRPHIESDRGPAANYGPGFFITFTGCVLGAIGGFMLRKTERPTTSGSG